MTFFLKYSPLLIIITIFNYTMPAESPRSLIEAARCGDITTVQSLIEQKIDLNQQGLGFTALGLAAWKNHIAIAKALIQAGANLNLQDDYGYTALMYATMRNHIAITNALIQAGANLKLHNNYGYTALMIAVEQNDMDIANALIKAEANLNLQNKAGADKNILGDAALTIAMK